MMTPVISTNTAVALCPATASRKYRIMPTPRYMTYVGLRPRKSDVDDQAKRPAMLNKDSRPTNPAAAVAATDDVSPSRKKSWIIGLACSRMPMPAVTLQNSTTHSSQNCGVLIAFAADTCDVVTSGFDFSCAGSNPAGFQPGAGTFTVKTPNII